MKKLTGLLLLILFLTNGCVGTKLKRGVQENTFYSTYPELAIKMAPELEYVDKTRSNDFTLFSNMDTGSSVSKNSFLFVDQLGKTLCQINIHKISRGYWQPPNMSKLKNVLYTGKEEYSGANYQYGVTAIKDGNGQCMLAKQLVSIFGANRDTLVEIYYATPVKNQLDCTDLHDVSLLNENQKKTINQFMKDSTEKMKFIDLAELNLEHDKE